MSDQTAEPSQYLVRIWEDGEFRIEEPRALTNAVVLASWLVDKAHAQNTPVTIRVIDRKRGGCLLEAEFNPDFEMDPEGFCRLCGCSHDDPCIDGFNTCGWTEPGLCTACARAAVPE